MLVNFLRILKLLIEVSAAALVLYKIAKEEKSAIDKRKKIEYKKNIITEGV
jgi:hypothetical protein